MVSHRYLQPLGDADSFTDLGTEIALTDLGTGTALADLSTGTPLTDLEMELLRLVLKWVDVVRLTVVPGYTTLTQELYKGFSMFSNSYSDLLVG